MIFLYMLFIYHLDDHICGRIGKKNLRRLYIQQDNEAIGK